MSDTDLDALIERLSQHCRCGACTACQTERIEAAAALAELREEAEKRNIFQDSRMAVMQIRAERAKAEVAKLKARVEQRDKQIAVYNSGGFADADALAEKSIELTAKIAALEAERDALKQDAERYRWLRECSPVNSGRMMGVRIHHYLDGVYVTSDWINLDDLDAAIDAARAKGK